VKRRLDRLFSELILTRDQRTCRWCGRAADDTGRPLKMDNSHIIPREILGLRWNPLNSVCLCFGCHKRRGTSWHGSPLEAAAWLWQYLGAEPCQQLLALVPAAREFKLTPETALVIEQDLKARLAVLAPAAPELPTPPVGD
jgi:hypothetical protein